ncbi:MAG: NnrU family protein [Xanthomonadales bacterium]|nr:NnrU family protein [Xanthomonadales bacterium]
MTVMLLGLVSFLGVHSVHALAPSWRARRIVAWGEGRWKLLYSLVSLVGFVLLVWGYGQARADAAQLLWLPPVWARHLAAALTLPAIVLLVAAYVPGNHLRARLGHPMLVGTVLWAAAHLLASGWLHAVVLFAAFAVWALLALVAALRRDRRAGVRRVGGRWHATALTVVLGGGLWWLFAFHLHGRLIGVAPLG